MIFDERFRARLEALRRLVARALEGRGGSGRSPFRARGGRVEFGGHRAYAPGDEAKDVDWAAYARLETLVVKEFEAPKEAHLLLLLDRSASMGLFGKEEAAMELGAALGWLALATGARTAFSARGGSGRWIEGPERFHDLLEGMRKCAASPEASLLEAVRGAPPSGGGGRRTAVILSDLYEAEDLARALAALRRRYAQVVCAQVLGKEELRPPALPRALFRDAESGETLAVELTEAARAAYRRAAEAFLGERKALCLRHGARHLLVTPGDDLLLTVERALL